VKTVTFETLQGIPLRDGGLNLEEVELQRSRFGTNDILEVAGSFWVALFVETLKDPMIWFLFGIGTLFLLTGEITDGITLISAALPLLLMDAFLHWRTQASTATLKSQLSSIAVVLREDKQIEIASQDIVPGDLVLLSPGILLPADGFLEDAKDLQMDESVLTGESLPVAKKPLPADLSASASKTECRVPDQVLAYAGTRVLTGQGLFRVLFTGSRTNYGEIVQSVTRVTRERTPLQVSINKLVQFLVLAAAVLCLLLAGIRIYQGHGWFDAILSAATLAVAAIPEEFPVVFTFFLGVGIYRLAKQRALVRRAVSVENIGRITLICTDKTGTITAGTLQLKHLEASPQVSEDHLLFSALAASHSETDPIDLAIRSFAKEKNIARPDPFRIDPFTEDRKRATGFVSAPQDKTFIFTKGAPELILSMSTLDPVEKERWRKRVSSWAKGGHKVLACGQTELPATPSSAEPTSGYRFLGLLAFEDPARPEVAPAMSYCRRNGIRVLMITGDHPDTAEAIAKDSGLAVDPLRVISAEEHSELFQKEWLEKHPNLLRNIHVVARCTPIQKLRIVQSLKQTGELVAVTGDGVNDVPALQAADIGIAMGERGTRSAKEVSSIILGDDNFGTLVNAIREGRQLYDNLRTSFHYLLLIHIPLVCAAALVPLADYPLVFLPVHIIWLELVIHPTALLSFQAAARGDGNRRANQKNLFSATELGLILGTGLALAGGLSWSFFTAINRGVDLSQARGKAVALLTLWSAGLGFFLSGFRSSQANFLATATFLSTAVLIQMSDSLSFLKVSPLRLLDWLEISGIVLALLTTSWLIQKRADTVTKKKSG
jgi:Ca2+-transporting ATPase